MPHHHPKVKLSPIQNAINWCLEDGGSLEFLATINTLHIEFSNLPAPDIEFLKSAESAVKNSIFLKYIEFCRHFKGNWIPVPSVEQEQLLSFQEIFSWNAKKNMWDWNERYSDLHTVELALTKKGYEALTKS